MEIRNITSISNPKIREALDIKKKRSEYRHTAFLIEGPHLIDMAIKSASLIRDIFFTSEFLAGKDGKEFVGNLSKIAGNIFEVPNHLLNKLSDTETPQGIVAVVSYQFLSLEKLPSKEKSLLVVIDGVQDPGNLGTIIRTSDAAGADAVVMLPETCDAFMPKAIRSTAGSIFNIPVVHTNPDALLGLLQKRKIKMFVTSADAQKSVYEADLRVPLAIVFGNEAHGVSKKLGESADMFLRIPIYGKAESLNVAASSAVCLYEAVRQRRTG